MADAFLSSPGFSKGTLSWADFLARFWDPTIEWGGETRAARFTALESKGGEGAYFGTFAGLVDFASSQEAAEVAKEVLIPIGAPLKQIEGGGTKIGSRHMRHILQQCARSWSTGGANTGAMTDDNVCRMFYGALQSLVYSAGLASWNTKSAEAQHEHMVALVSLLQSFTMLHTRHASWRAITHALVLVPGVNDMIHKRLAQILEGAFFGQEPQFEMLETVIRRTQRYERAEGAEEEVGFGAGVFALYALCPHLPGVVSKARSGIDVSAMAAQLLERFHADGARIRPALVAAKGAATARLRNAQALSALTTHSWEGTPLSTEATERLLAWLDANRDMSLRAPWVAWGYLPQPPVLSVPLRIQRFEIAAGSTVFSAHVRVKSETTFDVVGFKGVQWSGFGWSRPGTMTVQAHVLGEAVPAVGDTRRWSNKVANWQLTRGDHLMAPDQPSYALSGQEHALVESVDYGGRGRGGGRSGGVVRTRYEYLERPPLDIRKPFQVVLAHNSTITLVQDSVTCFRTTGQPLLCLKNVWFQCSFEATPPPVPTVDPRITSKRSWASMLKP
jgi:hypothetical protein